MLEQERMNTNICDAVKGYKRASSYNIPEYRFVYIVPTILVVSSLSSAINKYHKVYKDEV